MVKNLPANSGDTRNAGLVPGWGRSPGEGNGNPLQYPHLGNPMDRDAESDTTEHTHRRIAKQTCQLRRAM